MDNQGFIVLWTSINKASERVPHSKVFKTLHRAKTFARDSERRGCKAVSLRTVELRHGIHFVGSDKLPFQVAA